LIEAFSQLRSLRGTYQRLLAIRQCPEICLAGRKSLEFVIFMKDTAQKLHHSLLELVTTLNGLQADVPIAPLPVSLIEDISALSPSLVSSTKAMEDIIDKIQASVYPVILRGMSIYITKADRL
jgi:hypothetical protein